MRVLIGLLFGMLLTMPASSTGVYEAHNRSPTGERDCDNCACLSPDGDHDCDDSSKKGVPEPGSLGLLVLGASGAWLAARRRREK